MTERYKNKKYACKQVDKVINEVRADPERFMVSADTIRLVEEALAERRLGGNKTVITTNLPKTLEEADLLDDMDVLQLVRRANRVSWLALNKKLDASLRDVRKLNATPLAALVKAAGISFDKSQIIKGEATQHISLKAKIDVDLSPVEKLQMVLQMRESITTQNGE